MEYSKVPGSKMTHPTDKSAVGVRTSHADLSGSRWTGSISSRRGRGSSTLISNIKSDETMHDALKLATLGWQIFPAPVGTKKSHVAAARSGGPRWGATSDPDTLAGYWQQWPDANVGIATGPVSGIWCVDVDTPEGHGVDGFEWLRSVSLPDTVTSRSPTGSMHFYFRWPQDGGEPLRNSDNKLAPGVDVRGEGGMVVAPPSVKPDGSAYVWERDPWATPIADAPEWLVEAVRKISERPAMPTPNRVTPVSLREVEELLTYIDPDAGGYEDWMSVIAAIHEVSGGSDEGLALADAWSQRGPKYDPREIATKYASFRAGSGGYSMGTIAELAKRNGANVSAIGMKHRLMAAAGDYRPAGMTDTPAPSGDVGNTDTTEPDDIDPVQLIVDILQPNPFKNIPLVVADAAVLPAAERNRLLQLCKSYGIATALRDAIKEHRDTFKRQQTEEAGLIPDPHGNPIPNMENVRRVLTTRDEWTGTFGFSEFDGSVWVLRPEHRKLTDGDYLHVLSRMQSTVFPSVGPQQVKDGLEVAAQSNRFHPVRDYLNGLQWDGTPRLHTLFTDYFPCEVHHHIEGHADYVALAGQRFAIGAVARVMDPGAKVDTMPTLSGDQGLKKSTGLKALVGAQWFGDDMPDMGEKDAKEWLRGKWIAEIAELAAMRGKDVERIKSFLSTAQDSYRRSYGRVTEDVPRQTVFAGTVNGYEYLADSTGGRRFWPLRVRRVVDVDRITHDRNQLWAEAVALFRAGHRWWFEQGESKALEVAQEEERVVDLDEDRIAEWLRYTDGDVTPRQIAAALFPEERGDRGLSMRISRYLQSLGWERSRKVNGNRYWARTERAEPYQKPAGMGNVTRMPGL